MVEYSTLELLRHKINEIDREIFPLMDINERKYQLLEVLEDSVTYYEEDLESYVNYLKENMEQITQALEVITYDSNGENVEMNFVRLGRLLNGGTLSERQIESLSIDLG